MEAEAAEAVADGCPVEVRTLPSAPSGWAELADFDFVVVTGGAAAPARLLPLLRAGIPEGRSLLPAWSYGDDVVVGPLMTHGAMRCWSCAALRLGAARGARARPSCGARWHCRRRPARRGRCRGGRWPR